MLTGNKRDTYCPNCGSEELEGYDVRSIDFTAVDCTNPECRVKLFATGRKGETT